MALALRKALIGLDTNILLRWLIDETIWPDDHPDQTRAVEELAESGQTFFVNDVVIVETVWVLTRPMAQPKSILLQVLDRLLETTNVVIDRREVVVAAVADFRDGKPGFADHLIGHLNRHAGCEATLSFDADARRSKLFRELKPKR